MKTALAVVGILAVILLLASGPARQQIGSWLSNDYGAQATPVGYDQGYSQAPIPTPTAYQPGYPVQTGYAQPECNDGGCANIPVPIPVQPFGNFVGNFGGYGRQREVRTSFEFDETRQAPVYNRVWVQPQYRVVYQYGRPYRQLIRAGYYRQVSVGGGREKHVAFDFGQILNSFRQ